MNDVDARAAAEGLDGRRAGIARGGADDGERRCRARPSTRSISRAEELHGDVLERQRRPVEQLEQPVVAARSGPAARPPGGGSARRRRPMMPAQLVLADRIADERTHDAQRHLGVGEPGQSRDLIVRQAGPFGRHVEPAVARKPGQQRILEPSSGAQPRVLTYLTGELDFPNWARGETACSLEQDRSDGIAFAIHLERESCATLEG